MGSVFGQRLSKSYRCITILKGPHLGKGGAFYPVMHTFAKLLLSLPPIPSFALLLTVFYLNRWRGGANLVFAVIHAHNLPTQAGGRCKSNYPDLVRRSSRQLQGSHASVLIQPKQPALPKVFAFYRVVHTFSGFGEATISSLHVPNCEGVQRRHF